MHAAPPPRSTKPAPLRSMRVPPAAARARSQKRDGDGIVVKVELRDSGRRVPLTIQRDEQRKRRLFRRWRRWKAAERRAAIDHACGASTALLHPSTVG